MSSKNSLNISENEKLEYLLLFLANYVNYDSVSVYDKNGLKIIDTRNLTFGYIGGDEELLIEPILEYMSLLKNGLAIDAEYREIANELYPTVFENEKVQTIIRNYLKATE